jgi:hypothetical protein
MRVNIRAGYQVDRDGSILNMNYRGRGEVRYASLQKTRVGYLRVYLGEGTEYVHRLVAEAYVANPEGKPEIDHRDGDKTNNVPANLRWGTRGEGMRWARERSGTLAVPGQNTTAYTEVTSDYEYIYHKSISDACKAHGKKYSTFAPQLNRAVRSGYRMYGSVWHRGRKAKRKLPL